MAHDNKNRFVCLQHFGMGYRSGLGQHVDVSAQRSMMMATQSHALAAPYRAPAIVPAVWEPWVSADVAAKVRASLGG